MEEPEDTNIHHLNMDWELCAGSRRQERRVSCRLPFLAVLGLQSECVRSNYFFPMQTSIVIVNLIILINGKKSRQSFIIDGQSKLQMPFLVLLVLNQEAVPLIMSCE